MMKHLIDRILSSQNIYSAIHAMPSLLQERNLICGDKKRYKRDLAEIYKYGAPHTELLERCADRLAILLGSNSQDLFEVSFDLKFKGFDNSGRPEYRPIHYCDIETLICLVSMFQCVCFDEAISSEVTCKRELSSLSKLIPPYFYGNQISTDPRHPYKRWVGAYNDYINSTIKKAREYRQNQKYKTEAYLDIVEFFPSVNVGWLKNKILSLFDANLYEEDLPVLSRVLDLLLYFKIKDSIPYSSGELSMYYGCDFDADTSQDYFTRGLPQGLPHSYYFANVYMVSVDEMVKDTFEGDACYYVDDIVLYSNCEKDEFEDKIQSLNELLRTSEINSCEYSDNLDICCFQKRFFSTGIQFHNDGKCSIYDLSSEEYMSSESLSIFHRPTSLISLEIRNSFSDINDSTTLNEVNVLLEAIRAELKRLNGIEEEEDNAIEKEYDFDDDLDVDLGDENSNEDQRETFKSTIALYKKRLISYYKYYALRGIILKNKTAEEIDAVRANFYSIECGIQDAQQFADNLDLQLFQSYYRLLINSDLTYAQDYIGFVENIDKKLWSLSGETTTSKHLYYSKDSANLLEISAVLDNVNTYWDLSREVRQKQKKSLLTRGEEINAIEYILIRPECQIDSNDSRHLTYINDTDFQRQLLLIELTTFLSIPSFPQCCFERSDKRPLLWYQLRLLCYLRNGGFSKDAFEAFAKTIISDARNGIGTACVDSHIFSLIPLFICFVKRHDWIDSLINVHNYVYDMWKNGSKFLHFYTLHNCEHCATLIRKSLDLMTSCSFFDLNPHECYLLYLSCYLHDISMAQYPDVGKIISNNIGDILAGTKNDAFEIYKRVDSKVESIQRDNHHIDSARLISRGLFWPGLDSLCQDMVSAISIAHCEKYEAVYGNNVESITKLTNVNLKKLKIMLRIIDMLDMSQDRVSPIYLDAVDDVIPEESKFHWISHLAIKDCQISSQYDLNYAPGEFEETVKCNSELNPKNINERVTIKISLNTNQRSIFDGKSEKCEYCSMLSINNGIVLNTSEQPCGKCNCPFVCRWMSLKNKYLMGELFHAQEYIESDSNSYKTSFSVEYEYASGRDSMKNYISYVSRYLKKDKVVEEDKNGPEVQDVLATDMSIA